MLSSLLMPETASLTLSSMFWLNWDRRREFRASFRFMALTEPVAVVRGLSTLRAG